MRVKGRVLDMSGPSSQSLTYMLYDLYEASSIEAGHGTALETRRASEQPRDCSGFWTSPTTAILRAKGAREETPTPAASHAFVQVLEKPRCRGHHFPNSEVVATGEKKRSDSQARAPRSLDWLRLPRLEIRLSKETPATPGAPAVMAQAQQAQARSFGL